MKLTGKAAEQFAAEVRAHTQRRKAEMLASAKEDALRRHKEPFDLEKLESLCDTSNEGTMAPLSERQAKYEWKYYVSYPDIMTIEAFAKEVDELNRW